MPKILIVEDDRDIALGLEEDLARHGHQVETVGDGEQAVRRGRESGWDLIILDLMLPRKDGFEVCRELRHAGLRTPIIMLTAKTHEAEKILGLELGADDYVTKPFSPRELRARIQAVLRRATEGSCGHLSVWRLRDRFRPRRGPPGRGAHSHQRPGIPAAHGLRATPGPGA